MIKATFTPQNRMVYLELSFDVMSFMQQLRRASGKQDFQVSASPNRATFSSSTATRLALHRHKSRYNCGSILTLARFISLPLSPSVDLSQVVPNTVSIAKEDACEARVITEATHPYRITYASQVYP